MPNIKLFVFMMFLLGCSGGQGVQEKSHIEKRNLRTTWETKVPYVIMSAEQFYYEASDGWNLTDEDIINNETHILDCIKEESPTTYEKIGKYASHYYGVIENGNKYIGCSFFVINRVNRERWQYERFIVLDGGDRYFSMKLNMETKECDSFRTNPSAGSAQ